MGDILSAPTPPGWYPDPSGAPGAQRYWDGRQWGPTAPITAPAYGAGTPPKKSHTVRTVLLVVAGVFVLLIVVGIAAGGGKDKSSSTLASPTAPTSQAPGFSAPPAETLPSLPAFTTTTTESAQKQITYEVHSDGQLLSVNYYDALNNMTSLRDQPADWSASFDGKATYQLYSLGAQTKGEQVSCKITVDGKVVASNTASGRYALVLCSSA